MANILKINTPADYCEYMGVECPHPLVGVINFEEASPIRSSLNNYGVYAIFMHTRVMDNLTYGQGAFESANGSLICVAPGQIGGKEDDGNRVTLDGWALLFHPDLLAGTSLERDIRRYSYFDYRANEALRMDASERAQLGALMQAIREETERPRDSEQNGILVSFISAMLRFCNRAYARQFSEMRHESDDDILVKLSALLNDYFDRGLQKTLGVPGVQYFADRLCMSANYFSDMLRKSTGENAGNFIRSHIIRMAQSRLLATGNVSEVAYELGFDYPQHFSRMFKKHTGVTPSSYLTAAGVK